MTDAIEADLPARPERTGPAVYDGIAAVMLVMSQEGIGKSRETVGTGPKYKFRGIDDVYNALGPVMAQNRIMMLPRVLHREQVERRSSNGNAMFYTSVTMEFDIVSAEDGSKHTISAYGEAMDTSDKSTGKAMSYAFKAAALQAFAVPTEGDNDTENNHHEVAAREQQRGGERQGGRGRQQSDEPAADAKRYTDNFVSWMSRCDNIKALDRKIAEEERGIARLKADYPNLFSDFDHAKGLAYVRLDDVPF